MEDGSAQVPSYSCRSWRKEWPVCLENVLPSREKGGWEVGLSSWGAV